MRKIDGYLTAKEAAERFGISSKAFKISALEIGIPFVVGKQRTKYYPVEAVQCVIDSRAPMERARADARAFDDDILSCRRDGMSYKEVADALCIDREFVKNRCHALGVGGANVPQDRFKQSENSVSERVLHSGNRIEYVSGYERNSGKITVRCLICGNEWTTYYTNAVYGHARCQWCADARREYNSYIKRVASNMVRIQENIDKWFDKKKSDEDWVLKHTRICAVCGNEFLSRHGTIVCSDKCRKKHNNRKRDKRIDARIVDNPDITLESLFKRDKGVCHICGKPCDYEDYTVDGDIFIAGNWYPSIDHVIPISKGGRHSWDNVKLAHRLCNTVKSNKL